MQVIIGVDVGGTTISGGLVRRDGEIVAVVQTPTHVAGPGTALGTLLGLIGELLAEAGRRGLDVDGIGVGIPGAIDVQTGTMHRLPMHHVPELAGVPLAAQIRARTGVPAFVDNDVNALALAEWTFGRHRGVSSLVLLALGTGAGGAIIIDGVLVRGHSGWGGEIGHAPIQMSGPPCFCGGRGCLAVYVSGLAIEAKARERAALRPDSVLLRMAGGDPAALTARTVFEAATRGDAVATGIVDEACEALGAGLATIVNTVNPQVIVVTGGVARSFLPLEPEVLRCVRKYTIADALAGTRIDIVAVEKRQTVRGGAALVLYELARHKEAQDAEVSGRA